MDPRSANMIASHQQLQEALRQLARHKPQWKIEQPDPTVFWSAFQDSCQEVLDTAGSADHNWVQCKVWELLEGRR